MSLIEALSAQPNVAAALQNASQATGTDFDYLIKTAMKESSLNCSAKSSTSSACGLFQFTQQTWLSTLKNHGDELGYGDYAKAITTDANGKCRVADPAARQAILALRNDPHASAMMAGAYAKESESQLESRLGRSVSSGELYIAHFLGAGGAGKLISAAEDTPNARADVLFPEAASANKSIFYTNGRARTVGEVYDRLTSSQGGAEISLPDAGTYTAAASIPDAAARDLSATTLMAMNDADQMPGFASQDWMATTGEATYAVSTPVASRFASAPYTKQMGVVGQGNASAFGRAPLKLSSDMVQMLSTLDPMSLVHKEKDDKEDDKTARAANNNPSARIAINLS